MSDENSIRLLYEWNTRMAKLDFAIRKAEHQLSSVNKRLEHIRYDGALYGGMIGLPPVLYGIIVLLVNSMHSQPFVSFPLLHLFAIFKYLLLCGYLILLPFNTYYLLRSIRALMKNRMPEEQIAEPPRAGTLIGGQTAQEPTCRAEQQKLIYILSR